MSSRTRLKSVSDRESAADMGMRSGEPPARIRFAPRTGLRKSPVASRRWSAGESKAEVVKKIREPSLTV